MQALTDYKAQVTGKEVNTVTENPPFVSASDLHFPLNSTTLASNSGKPVALVTTDIDGNARSLSTPDMGADEFDLGTTVVPVKNETGALVYTLNKQIVADLSKVTGEAIVSVIDVKGSVLKTMNNNSSLLLKFNMNNGIYLVRIQNGNKLSIQKIVLY